MLVVALRRLFSCYNHRPFAGILSSGLYIAGLFVVEIPFPVRTPYPAMEFCCRGRSPTFHYNLNFEISCDAARRTDWKSPALDTA